MTMKPLDIHYMAVLAGMSCALEIAELLPDTDLVYEQSELIGSSLQILMDILDGKHYGTSNLSNFLNHVEETKKQVYILKGKII
jgi:hypothetical protein